MEKKHCIYCGTAEDLSESDIIPDALTNARIYNRCVCRVEHNNRFSDEFEGYVAQKLAFLTNQLNIKSSKSKSYPYYDAKIRIEETEYEAKKIHFDGSIFEERKVIWNEDHTIAMGDMDIIRKIAKAHNMSEFDIKIVDINNNNDILVTVKPNLDIFFSTEMFRLVAKIAYEWYCSKNDVCDKFDDFNEIINFIIYGLGDSIVSIVSDDDLIDKFNGFCNNGSHCLVGYISNSGEVNVLVDMFGLIIYNVRVCKDIPKFCDNNCLLTKLNLDSTREELSLNNYNDLLNGILKNVFNQSNSNSMQYVGDMVNGVEIVPCICKKDFSGNMFFINIIDNIQNGIVALHARDDKVFNILLNNIRGLLNEGLVNKKTLKRFINDKIDFSSEIKLNPNVNDKKSIFNLYILLQLGSIEQSDVNQSLIENMVEECFGKYEVILSDEVCKKIKNNIFKHKNYDLLIKRGAKKVLEWK